MHTNSRCWDVLGTGTHQCEWCVQLIRGRYLCDTMHCFALHRI